MEQEILAGLLQRGVPLHVAQGIVANMIAESGLNPGVNEKNPTVQGSRGGFGLNQWTGPRRVQFERFAADRGVSPNDTNAQLDFTLWELQHTERGAWNALGATKTAEDAARVYSDKFLRPGIPHMDRRLAEAGRLSGQNYFAPGQQQAGPQQPQNALAAYRPQIAQLDANAFAAPTNIFRNYMGA